MLKKTVLPENLPFLLAFLLVSSETVVHVFLVGGAYFVTAFENFGFVSAILFAIFGMLDALLTSSKEDRFRVLWSVFLCGFFLELGGEITWMIYSLVLNIQLPPVSLADAFYVTGLLVFLFGICLIIRTFLKDRRLWKKHILLFVAAFLAVLIFLSFFYPLLRSPEAPLSENLLNIAYPLIDLILIAGTVNLILFPVEIKMKRILMLMLIGLLITSASDLTFSFFYSTASDRLAMILMIFWISGILIVGLSGYIHAAQTRRSIQE